MIHSTSKLVGGGGCCGSKIKNKNSLFEHDLRASSYSVHKTNSKKKKKMSGLIMNVAAKKKQKTKRKQNKKQTNIKMLSHPAGLL